MEENEMINDYIEEYEQYYSDSVAAEPPLADEQQEPEIILTDSVEEEKPDITKEDLKEILDDIINGDEEENEEENEEKEVSQSDSDSLEEFQIIDTITSEQADEIINRLDALYQIMITPEEELTILEKPLMEYSVQETLSLFLVSGLLVAIFVNIIKKGVPRIWR